MGVNFLDLSFIIPFYNGEAFIGRLVSSVKNTYILNSNLSIELIIIIDSPPTDITKIKNHLHEIIGGLFPFIIYSNEENVGVAVTRNRGLAIARGTHLVFLDQDDEVSADYLKHINRLLLRKSDLIVCNGTFQFAHNVRTSIYYLIPKIKFKNLSFYDIIRSPGQVVVRRKYFGQTKFPETQKYFGTDDKFAWILLLLKFPDLRINYVSKKIYIAHIHGSNYSKDFKQLYLSGLEHWQQIKESHHSGIYRLDRYMQRSILFYKYRTGQTIGFAERLAGLFQSILYHSYPNKIVVYLMKKIKLMVA